MTLVSVLSKLGYGGAMAETSGSFAIYRLNKAVAM